MTRPRPMGAPRSPGPVSELPHQFRQGRLTDDVWLLPNAASGEVTTLRWSAVMLEGGSALTNPNNAELLQACKKYVVLYAQGKLGVRPRAGTIVRSFSYLAAFVAWLSRHQISTFSSLTTAHVVGYRNYINRRNIRIAGTLRSVGQKRLASDSKRKLLSIITNLIALQRFMEGDGTTFTRRDISDINAIVQSIEIRTEQPTKRIPDDVFGRLLEAAVAWISVECPKILRVLEVHNHYRSGRSLGPRGIPRGNEATQRRNFLASTSDILKPSETIEVKGVQRELLSLTYREVQSLVLRTRGACFVIIAGMTGMRVSEILSLMRGCVRSVALQNRPNVLKLAGTLYKTSRASDGEPAEWVAGWDELSNPVALAVDALEKLPRIAGSRGLFAAAFGAQRKKAAQNSLERISRSHAVKTLRGFTDPLGLEGWKFAPHQFRKTFARFVALSGSTSVLALMRHYKHVSVLMTERYLPNDPEFLDDLVEASEELIAERLDYIFGADSLGGLAGERIIANNDAYRGTAGAEARTKLVQLTMRDSLARIRLTIYGICLYDEPKAKCDGKIKNVGLETCIGCANFAASVENLPFWLDFRDLLRINIRDQERLGVVNLDVLRQMRDVEEVITAIGGCSSGRSA